MLASLLARVVVALPITRARTLLATLTLLAAALVGCRPSIAAVPVQARTIVAAAPAAGMKLCWVESARVLGFTASAIVVRHPDGDLLVDGGNSTHFDDEIKVYGGKDRRWFRRFAGALLPREPLSARLERVGVDPASLRWLLPTHAHIDHIGGFLDLPPTPVLLSAAELELVQRARKDVIFEVIPAHAEAVAPMAKVITFTEAPYEIFERHADVFGDGSVVIVPLSGHTPGSVGVFLNLPDGRRMFHVGDAVNSRRQTSKLQGRSPGLRRSDSNQGDADTIVAGLHELAAQAPEIALIPAHERAAWQDAFGSPGAPCPQ